MHYKNKRLAVVNDWVCGPTHNSQGKIAVGFIIELMEGQGNCSARLWIFPSLLFRPYNPDENTGGQLIHHVGVKRELYSLGGKEDYADVKELIRVDDGWRLTNAVIGSGLPESPYFTVNPE